MKIQPLPQDKTTNNDEAKSFQLYTGKAPLALQIVGGLMWLSGILMILQGIPLLLIFGLGIIPIVLGIFSIKYARAIFKMQKKGYKGALVLYALIIVFNLLRIVIPNGKTNFANTETLVSLGGALLFMLILYAYREKFVN